MFNNCACVQEGCGRSAAVGFQTLSSLEWDTGFNCIFGELLQEKTSKMKLNAFVASENRFLCFFLAFADVLATCPNAFKAPVEMHGG